MKIKMIDLAAGPDGVMQSGQEYDVADNFAKSLIDKHHAISINDKSPEADGGVKTDGTNDTGKTKNVPGGSDK